MSRFIIDIDGVISKKLYWSKDDINNRERTMFLAIDPDLKVIGKINLLYSAGHTIVLHTSRMWHDFEVTTEWLNYNHVLYHTLIMGKPLGDYYIDDRNMSVEELLKQ